MEINADEISKLTLEAESFLIKMQEKIGQDETRQDKNYQELDLIAQDIETIEKTMPDERDIDKLLKPCK